MGDSGKWWQGIIDKITGDSGLEKMTNDELKREKQQVISQLNLTARADEWGEVSRLAKNVIIYDNLIELQKDITKMDARQMAEKMEELLDEEFKPVMPGQSGHDEFLKKVEALALGFDDDDGDFSEFGAMKPKLKRRKSRKRKSRKRKSRKIKSKKRKRSSKKSRRRR